MTNLAYKKNNVVSFGVIEKTPKLKKNGEVKKTHSNKKEGISSEVYGLYSSDEIKSVVSVLNDAIEKAEANVKSGRVKKSHTYLKVARRNKMLFIVGINIGIRASDIATLKWSYFLDGKTFKESYSIKPKKTRRTGKYVKLFFNDAVKMAINEYISYYPIEDLDGYVFTNDVGNPMTTQMLYKIIKDSCVAAGIKKNIGSHSLRKTWGFWCWNSAEDKNKAIVILQSCFGHASTQTTMKYIGLLDDDKEAMYNSINLGMQ